MKYLLNRSCLLTSGNVQSAAEKVDVSAETGGDGCRGRSSSSDVQGQKVADQGRRLRDDLGLGKVGRTSRGQGSLQASVTFDEGRGWLVVNLKDVQQ